ncbi:iron transporter [Haloarculaceae archaeon H-GB2-1]|nr:iron transporter [Haloarculaceae archaeon H-GB1-1]MEA5389466.1 iron transporter [Haloarculaceae archaeon H-GB11]MEA5410084.1 iron transporter [Haloarculaceae archaeon H-GB2-1]
MGADPSKTASDEVDEKQLELAGREGDAYMESLEYMASEVAHTGATKELGDFVVGFAQEEAEGMYRPDDDGHLQWVEPDEENCHLEVAVADRADGRFVPNLSVEARLETEDGEAVGPFEVPYVWHPGLHHYGRNVTVPGDGTYTLTVTVDPPTFPRHDRTNGDRYDERVSVTFDDVDVETGRE